MIYLFSISLLLLGISIGYISGYYVMRKKKNRFEKRIVELELDMIEDKNEIFTLTELIKEMLKNKKNGPKI